MTAPRADAQVLEDVAARLRSIQLPAFVERLQRLLAGEVAPVVGLAVLVFVQIFPYLGSPYYWDSTQYIAGADYIMKHGLYPLLPEEWDVVGHPVLVLQILALVWLAVGQNAVSSHLLMGAFAFITLLFTYRVGTHLFGRRSGLVAASLLGFYPLFRTQSTVITLDLPAAAFSIMTVYFFLRGRVVLFLLCGCAMVLSKETTVFLVPCMLLYTVLRDRGSVLWHHVALRLAIVSLPIFVLVGWFWYHVQATGWLAPADYPLSTTDMLGAYLPPRIFTHTGGPYMFLWLSSSYFGKVFLVGILTLLIAFCSFSLRPFLRVFLGPPSWKALASALRAQPLWRVWGPAENLVLLALPIVLHLLFMSTNFTLHRYLLPEYCLFFIMSATALVRVCKEQLLLVAAALGMIIVFVAGSSWSLFGYSLPSPSTMAYTDFVETHREADAFIEKTYPDKVVLAGWPQYVELGMPLQGYVDRPLKFLAYAYGGASRFKARVTSLGGRYYTDPSTIGRADFDLVYYSVNSLQPDIPQIIERYHLPLIAEFRKNNARVSLYGSP